ncbi:MAG: hypothetical protein QOD93_7309 [Acetobacteraceae bacterium]|nr:hypothetical protein [Acetobacteraceae bacterium]
MGLPLRVGCPVRVRQCRAASRRARDAQSPVTSFSVFVQNIHLIDESPSTAGRSDSARRHLF